MSKAMAEQRVAYIEFMNKNYRPGLEITGYGNFYSCRTCGALVHDTDDALERHVRWHDTLITTDATYIMRSPR